MMPRTAIAQIAKMIGRELDTGVGPSEEALAAGPILAGLAPLRKSSEACLPKRTESARTIA
jgi:hypothetical protein